MLFLSPFVLPFILPRTLVLSLKNSRVLLDGQWKKYMGFHPTNSLSYLFYRIQWENIQRFGRNGESHLVGLGKYALTKWFHVSLLSSYIYSNAGAVTMLGGTLITFLSFLVFIEIVSFFWVAAVLLVAICSTTVFVMAFYGQNYQILGWLWIPAFILALLTESWFIASILLLTSASFAITPFVLIFLPCLFVNSNVPIDTYFLVLLPSACYVVWKVTREWFRANSVDGLSQILGLIGFKSNRSVRYQRASKGFNFRNIWIFSNYSISAAILAFSKPGYLPMALLISISIGLLNEAIVRIADFESILMLLSITLVSTVLQSPPNPLNLLAMTVPLFLHPTALGIAYDEKSLWNYIKPAYPFDHTPLLDKLNSMLGKLPRGGTTLMVFADPNGIYEKLFDGFRSLIEPIILVAMDHDRRIVPDWYFISETNFVNSNDVWFQDLDSLLVALEDLEADSILVFILDGDCVIRDRRAVLSNGFDLVDKCEISSFIGSTHLPIWLSKVETEIWVLK
jgi:hypothetical protein